LHILVPLLISLLGKIFNQGIISAANECLKKKKKKKLLMLNVIVSAVHALFRYTLCV
jgi:hypothetical protein